MQVLLIILRNGNHFRKHKNIHVGKGRNEWILDWINGNIDFLVGHVHLKCRQILIYERIHTYTYLKGHTNSWNLYLIMMLTKKLQNKKVNEYERERNRAKPMFYLPENLSKANEWNEQTTEYSSLRLQAKTARFFLLRFLLGKMPGYVSCLCSMSICLSLSFSLHSLVGVSFILHVLMFINGGG